jgi:hypothetical protein
VAVAVGIGVAVGGRGVTDGDGVFDAGGSGVDVGLICADEQATMRNAMPRRILEDLEAANVMGILLSNSSRKQTRVVGGAGQRHFDTTNPKLRKLPESAQSPTRPLHVAKPIVPAGYP